jgi:ribosomal protein L32
MVAGFCYDEPVIRKIASDIQDPAWITNKHSIISFVAAKIRGAYSAKPHEEQRKLFAAAFSWPNTHEEYTTWHIKQIKADSKRELDSLRKTPPEKCPECGAALRGNQKCENCGGYVTFDDETHAWIYNHQFDFSSASGFFKTKTCGGNEPRAPSGKAQTTKTEAEEIDF